MLDWIFLSILSLVSIYMLTRYINSFKLLVVLVAIFETLLYLVVCYVNYRYVYPIFTNRLFYYVLDLLTYDSQLVLFVFVFVLIGYFLCVPIYCLMNKLVKKNNILSTLVCASSMYIVFSIISLLYVFYIK